MGKDLIFLMPSLLMLLIDYCSTKQCSTFHYDTSIWKETIVQRYDLVCSRVGWIAVANSMFMFAGALGCYVCGICMDKVSKKAKTCQTFITFFDIFSLVAKRLASG